MMMLPEINEIHADFVLNYAKTDGLNSLVRNIGLSENKDNISADLQPDLINAFSIKFPASDLEDLDRVVEWIILASVAKRRDELNEKFGN